jgi:arsenite methyltransferase
MKPLYLSTPTRQGLGPCLRPGGPALTERILELLAPVNNSKVLDAGCGTGASMAILKNQGIDCVFGLDLDNGLLKEARGAGQSVARGDLAQLPLADTTCDLVLCECVWNLTDKKRVLNEFARILKPGGMLAMTDIYSRAAKDKQSGFWPVRCCFSSATDLTTVQQQVEKAGFTVTAIEDHTRLLKKTAAEFIFAHGSLKKFWQAVTGDATLADAACDASTATRPGLFLLLAERKI